eukprot:gene757-45_t
MIKIDVAVVDNDIPLLIGRPTMTKLGMVVDTKNHQGLFGTTKQEKRNKAVKLHGQFAHVSKEHLIWLLKDGGCGDQEFLVEVEKDVMSANSEVNKGKLWILYLVDEATRYTAPEVIGSKRTEVVMEKIFKIWLTYFGTPKKMHSDNGGEFSSHVMREMHEKLILRQDKYTLQQWNS